MSAVDHKRMDFSKHPRKDLRKDEPLFLEGESSRAMYVLLAGELGVFRRDVQVATIDEPLSIVGEISALTAEPRNATVRATKQSKLVVLDNPDELFGEYPQLGAKLARLLAGRLSLMNGHFVELKNAVVRARAERDMEREVEKEVGLADFQAAPTLRLAGDEAEEAAVAAKNALAATDAAAVAERPGAFDEESPTMPLKGPAVEEARRAAEVAAAEARATEASRRAAIAAAVRDAPDSGNAGSWPAVEQHTPRQRREIDAKYKDQVFETLDSILDWDEAGT